MWESLCLYCLRELRRMKEKNSDLTEIAKMLTWINPEINVLDNEYRSEHNALVQVIEQVLHNENVRKSLLLPELRKNTDTLGVFSDYGGESADSKYLTYSFLVCDMHAAKHFTEIGMNEIREKNSLGTKEIAFKDLRHGPTKRSLKGYLDLLDKSVPGFLYSVVIDKKISTVFDRPDKKIPKHIVKTIESYGFGKWKPAIAEKMLRVVHILGYLIGLFSKDGQNFFWMTDNDAIAPNQEGHMNMLSLLSNTLELYTKNKFKVFGGAVPFEEKDTSMLDLLSSTDLVAGAIEHYLTRKDKLVDFSIKEEADVILQWLAHDGIALKKRTTIIRPDGEGIIGANLVFELNDQPKDVTIIPIPM